jgi:hypothetical protein
MTRALEAATKTALQQPVLPFAAIIRLDVLDDPLFCWTGIGNLVFTAGQTGDVALDTFTFTGTGTAAEISTVSEGVGGSDALEIGLPGVDIDMPMLRQLMRDKRRWQFRRAWVWLLTLDPVTDAIVGKPFRIKTGRMDQMPYSENAGQGIVKCRIEGQQAYGDEALGTRYSEQIDINPLDKSQNWVHSLANMTPALGQVSAAPGAGGGGATSGGGSFETMIGRFADSIRPQMQ